MNGLKKAGKSLMLLKIYCMMSDVEDTQNNTNNRNNNNAANNMGIAQKETARLPRLELPEFSGIHIIGFPFGKALKAQLSGRTLLILIK
jgi:hypothetical protein